MPDDDFDEPVRIAEAKFQRRQPDSAKAHTAAVANDAVEFPKALASRSADWVYVRYLPTKVEMDAVHRAGKRAFIAGPTVSGNLPKNWQDVAIASMDAILTDYPLSLRITLRDLQSDSD